MGIPQPETGLWIAVPSLSTGLDDSPRDRHDSSVLAALVAAVALAGTPALDPQHLPRLPERGFARQAPHGIVLETFAGKPIGSLPGLHLPDHAVTHGLLLQDQRARLFSLDRSARRLRPVTVQPQRYPGCRVLDGTMRQQVLVCGRRIDVVSAVPGQRTKRLVVAGPRRGGGSWIWAEFSPNGKGILAQWSGECESPSAYLIANGKVRPYGGSDAVESVGLGWLPGSRAVVSFWAGTCGSAYPVPGLYAVPLRGPLELLRRFHGVAAPQLAMWGG